MADDDAPRFGQRSENWTPDGSGPTPDGTNAGGGAGWGPKQASSWPQYGELDHSAQLSQPTWGQYQNGASPQGGNGPQANSGASSQNVWPQYGGGEHSAPQNASWVGGGASGGAGRNGTQMGGPQPMNVGNPYQPGAAGPGVPVGDGYGQPVGASGPYNGTPKPPSRTMAIVLMVVGALMTLVLSVVVFFVTLVSGLNVAELVETASTTSSGDTVTVDDTGAVLVVALDDGALSCKLTNTSGDVTQMEAMAGTADMLTATGLTPGDYVLECDDPSRTLSVITGISPDQMVNSTLKAFVWGSAIGLVGVVMFIVGTVKLVRTNRKRREIQRTAWQQRY